MRTHFAEAAVERPVVEQLAIPHPDRIATIATGNMQHRVGAGELVELECKPRRGTRRSRFVQHDEPGLRLARAPREEVREIGYPRHHAGDME
ncbi:MAG TPA: hypothetical protein VFT22_37720, partial [Kofleriaceae bacterium]|nr:hypothetical protein [Kofleriaceae bacterium]